METLIQAFVIAFREGLEAFLIIAILLQFLDKTNNKRLKSHLWHGLLAGVAVSLVLGFILAFLSSKIGAADSAAKLWESIASFVAVVLISTFIVWMIKHGSKIKEHIENKASFNLSKMGIFFLAMVMVAREGAEIVIFSFAGKYDLTPLLLGVLASIILVLLIFHSFVKVRIGTIFNFTLLYLILQAGFLMGYSVHEGLSASKDLGMIQESNSLFVKAFDLSGTALNNKEGVIGIPLYVAFGWYAKPEWAQFILQYAYTFLLLGFWHSRKKRVKM